MKRLMAVAIFALGCASCGSLPTAPTPTAPVPEAYLYYDIHIPDPLMTVAAILTLKSTPHPSGLLASPDQAQRLYDYRGAYGQSNVFLAGTCQLVVSPVSSFAAFMGSLWPDAGLRTDTAYRWEGRFVFDAAPLTCE